MSVGIRPSADKPEKSGYITYWYIREIDRIQEIVSKEYVIKHISDKDLTSLAKSCKKMLLTVEKEQHDRHQESSSSQADMDSNG